MFLKSHINHTQPHQLRKGEYMQKFNTQHWQQLLQQRNRAAQHAGYTIDQTVLIVAIIAILITIIVTTVGIDLINRASGTKMSSQLKQVEDSVSVFFANNLFWPHQDPAIVDTTNAGYLAADDTTALTNAFADEFPGFEVVGILQHTFGIGGGNIEIIHVQDIPAAGTDRYVVLFRDVPYEEANNADRAIDGRTAAGNEGRLRIGENDGALADVADCNAGTDTAANDRAADADDDGLVDVCYQANITAN